MSATHAARAILAALHDEHSCFAFGYALRLTHHDDKALDLAQDAWLKVASALEGEGLDLPTAARARGYLKRVLRNLFVDQRRRELSQPRSVSLDYRATPDGGYMADTIPKEGADPAEALQLQLADAERRNRALAAFQDLGRRQPEQAEAIQAHTLESIPFAEIPARLRSEASAATWRQRHHRGLATLRRSCGIPPP